VVGSASNKAYNGALLADQHDVVVVGVKYRLGVLGFPGASIPNKNPGLMDERAAVKWLRDNVEPFGGDPKRMIMFRQSAGRILFFYKTEPSFVIVFKVVLLSTITLSDTLRILSSMVLYYSLAML
jgi:carboxylesterase type B